MGVVTIDLRHVDYLTLIDKSLTIDDLLASLFFDTATHTNILAELNRYHEDEEGAPVVGKFKITGVTYNAAGKSGQVRLSYTVDFTFACADKQSTTRHTETSNFIIDTDIGSKCEILNLIIHDKISRDTYEEF